MFHIRCPRCGKVPELMPFYGQWLWQCACLPVQTYVTNNTGNPSAVKKLDKQES